MSNDKQVGIKHDNGKPPMDLIPYESLVEIAKVLDFGAKKYSAHNWRNGINYSRLIAATMRHLGKFNSGQNLDEETNLSEVAHAATNLIFLLWMQKYRPEFDDRYVNPPRPIVDSEVLESNKVLKLEKPSYP